MTGAPAWVWSGAIGALVFGAAIVMWLVTTFLFAFSGSQYRMVTVVGVGALIMVVLPLAGVAIGWRVGTSARRFMVAAAMTGIGWLITVVVEWLLSFWFGAG